VREGEEGKVAQPTHFLPPEVDVEGLTVGWKRGGKGLGVVGVGRGECDQDVIIVTNGFYS
jgi:hypothetical protein